MTAVTLHDVSSVVDPLDMPCCPLCDNAILEWQEMAVVVCEGSKALAHGDCVENTDEQS